MLHPASFLFWVYGQVVRWDPLFILFVVLFCWWYNFSCFRDCWLITCPPDRLPYQNHSFQIIILTQHPNPPTIKVHLPPLFASPLLLHWLIHLHYQFRCLHHHSYLPHCHPRQSFSHLTLFCFSSWCFCFVYCCSLKYWVRLIFNFLRLGAQVFGELRHEAGNLEVAHNANFRSRSRYQWWFCLTLLLYQLL